MLFVISNGREKSYTSYIADLQLRLRFLLVPRSK